MYRPITNNECGSWFMSKIVKVGRAAEPKRPSARSRRVSSQAVMANAIRFGNPLLWAVLYLTDTNGIPVLIWASFTVVVCLNIVADVVYFFMWNRRQHMDSIGRAHDEEIADRRLMAYDLDVVN